MEQLEREGESIDIPTKASQAQQAAALEPLNIKIIESMKLFV